MYDSNHNASPFNAIPPVVVAVALAIIGVELLMQAAEAGFIGGPQGIAWRLEAITVYGVFDSVFNWMIETWRVPPEHLLRFVSYSFLHAGFTHAAFAVVMLLAIGKMVAEAFSSLAFLAIYFLSTIVGALAYVLLLNSSQPLIGAFPAVYGMIGALSYMLWIRARFEGSNQLRAFSLILALMGIQLFFKLVFGGADDWVADIAGFLTGFGLSFFLAPQGGARIVNIVNRLRRRR
ncbi:MAG: rhomboid family intramembrane serine protease [Rhodobacteraceae bacterium]|nr:rhomboid family intramembrane serine protease [Paracoccaceae bacterium]